MLRMAVLCTALERRWAAANGVHCARVAVGGRERGLSGEVR